MAVYLTPTSLTLLSQLLIVVILLAQILLIPGKIEATYQLLGALLLAFLYLLLFFYMSLLLPWHPHMELTAIMDTIVAAMMVGALHLVYHFPVTVTDFNRESRVVLIVGIGLFLL